MIINEARSHPKWLIDEKVKISRALVWINPIKPPTSTEIIIIKIFKKFSWLPDTQISNKGLIFWTVSKTNKTTHEQDSATVKSQLWKGAAPNLIDNPKNKNKIQILTGPNKLISSPKINKTEARVWVKKYLIAASDVSLFFLIKSRGIKAKVFNSKPTHLINKEGEDKIIVTLKTILKINNNNEGDKNIGKKVTTYRRGMSP